MISWRCEHRTKKNVQNKTRITTTTTETETELLYSIEFVGRAWAASIFISISAFAYDRKAVVEVAAVGLCAAPVYHHPIAICNEQRPILVCYFSHASLQRIVRARAHVLVQWAIVFKSSFHFEIAFHRSWSFIKKIYNVDVIVSDIVRCLPSKVRETQFEPIDRWKLFAK